jgi:hypothetical protein
MNRIIKEAIEIELHPNNIQQRGLVLSGALDSHLESMEENSLQEQAFLFILPSI